MKPEVVPSAQRTRILKLTVFQTWLACIGGVIGIGTAAAAVAHGWIGLPEKVDRIDQHQQKIEETTRPLMELTNRVHAIEDSQKQVWSKLSADHDLLIGINQKLIDVKEQQAELSTDVKALKK